MKDRKKILLVSPPFIPTSKDSIAGTEQMMFNLGRALVEQGHNVFTLAKEDSKVYGTLIPSGFEDAVPQDSKSHDEYIGQLLTSQTFEFNKFLNENKDTNVIIENFTSLGLLRELSYGEGPQVLNRLNMTPNYFLLPPIFEKVKKQIQTKNSKSLLVPISQSIADEYQKHYNFSDYQKKLPIVRNGIITENFEFNSNPDNYMLFLGRIKDIKGPHHAIKAAKENNYKIIIAGGGANGDSQYSDDKFFNREIKPLIDSSVELFGPANLEQKVKLMKNAKAVLTPIQWNEPGGLVQLEAMACGTPVVCYNRGGPAEAIIHGETGFLANNFEEFSQYVGQIDEIDRSKAREHMIKNFDYKVMGANYSKLFI